jgi:hypothetical protein
MQEALIFAGLFFLLFALIVYFFLEQLDSESSIESRILPSLIGGIIPAVLVFGVIMVYGP